ncbi:uncharacterized protein LOC101862708 [Aplysia californica]|uniref:Uncharacterized protein LOC101862708 n=1 Tax=Aplysia californica TaxID=6500 RepID=A0ABM0JFZ3_APLCA|nr:uncharacterized protein LOC101862708 [Aplysia californica]
MVSNVFRLGFCLAVFLAMSTADEFRDPLRYASDGSAYCTTHEIRPTHMKVGDTARTNDCYDCTCSWAGLYCRGFGVKEANNAYHINVPRGCELIIDGCNYYYVSIYNRRVRCN